MFDGAKDCPEVRWLFAQVGKILLLFQQKHIFFRFHVQLPLGIQLTLMTYIVHLLQYLNLHDCIIRCTQQWCGSGGTGEFLEDTGGAWRMMTVLVGYN